MTENEALKVLKRDLEIQKENKALPDGIAAMEIAIQALEEIQQYKAIGTVEEVAEMSNSYINYFHKVRKYHAIGTIEEFKALKEKEERFDRNIKMFNEIGLEIRNKAIDETCLKIFNHLLSEIEWNRVLVEDWEAFAEEFKEIAEQMKAGEKDEKSDNRIT